MDLIVLVPEFLINSAKLLQQGMNFANIFCFILSSNT